MLLLSPTTATDSDTCNASQYTYRAVHNIRAGDVVLCRLAVINDNVVGGLKHATLQRKSHSLPRRKIWMNRNGRRHVYGLYTIFFCGLYTNASFLFQGQFGFFMCDGRCRRRSLHCCLLPLERQARQRGRSELAFVHRYGCCPKKRVRANQKSDVPLFADAFVADDAVTHEEWIPCEGHGKRISPTISTSCEG